MQFQNETHFVNFLYSLPLCRLDAILEDLKKKEAKIENEDPNGIIKNEKGIERLNALEKKHLSKTITTVSSVINLKKNQTKK